MIEVIIDIVQEIKKELVKVIGKSLHRLGHELNCSITTVERMINVFPLALFELNKHGIIPIEASSIHCESVKYVPVWQRWDKDTMSVEKGNEVAC